MTAPATLKQQQLNAYKTIYCYLWWCPLYCILQMPRNCTQMHHRLPRGTGSRAPWRLLVTCSVATFLQPAHWNIQLLFTSIQLQLQFTASIWNQHF